LNLHFLAQLSHIQLVGCILGFCFCNHTTMQSSCFRDIGTQPFILSKATLPNTVSNHCLEEVFIEYELTFGSFNVIWKLLIDGRIDPSISHSLHISA
jgi:hypothetical protein